MSGKRRALEQLTDRTAYDRDDEDESDEQQSFEQKKASADILSKRKILKPRSFKSSTAATAGAPTAASSFTPKKPSPLVSNSPISNNTHDSVIDRNSKIKALNIKFIDALNNAKQNNVTADLRPLVNKYITFYEGIVSDGAEKSVKPSIASANAEVPDSKPNAFGFLTKSQQTEEPAKTNSFGFLNNTASQQPNAFSFLNKTEPASNTTPNSFGSFSKPPVQEEPKKDSTKEVQPASLPKQQEEKLPAKSEEPIEVIDDGSDSDSDSEEEFKVEGPKFTVAAPPTTKNSVFTFGEKAKPEIEFSDSDSEDDIKIEGPKFTLNTNPTENKSFFGGFKLNNNGDSGFKFTLSQTQAPAEEQKSESAPAAAPAATQTPSAFGSFAPPQPASEKEQESQPAPAVPNSVSTTSSTAPKNNFTFGGSSTTSPFVFDATKASAPAPASTFSSNTTTTPSTTTAAPSAETKAANDTSKNGDDKPKFVLGVSASSDKPLFPSTGSTSQDKPAFPSFGSSQGKPMFSFGAATTSDNKPAEQPKFTGFGTGAPVASSTGTEAEKPKFSFSSAFNFGSSNTGSQFNFTPSAPTPAAAPTAATNGDESEKVEEHEPTTQFTPVVKLDKQTPTATGEEEEVVKYQKRSKLLLLQNNEYQSKGLGELKILYNSETAKTRLLIRSDGSLRVLLNSAIHKNFKFEKMGAKGNMVKFPTINAEGALETYVIQVKTGDDGDELLKAIEEGKS